MQNRVLVSVCFADLYNRPVTSLVVMETEETVSLQEHRFIAMETERSDFIFILKGLVDRQNFPSGLNNVQFVNLPYLILYTTTQMNRPSKQHAVNM
jgi:hypothetical protein